MSKFKLKAVRYCLWNNTHMKEGMEVVVTIDRKDQIFGTVRGKELLLEAFKRTYNVDFTPIINRMSASYFEITEIK